MLDSISGLYGRMGLLGSLITGVIIVFFIGGFYVNILVRRRYLSLSAELAAFCAGDIKEFSSEMLTWVTEEYRASLERGVEGINSPVIIQMALAAYQKPCITGESFLKKVNGLLITIGLFGTFLGLTSAIGSIGGMLIETSAETLMTEAGINSFQILISTFEGMSVAFITSLFGTGFSIVLSVASTLIGSGNAKELFVAQLEEYLDIKLASEAMELKAKLNVKRKDEINILADTLSESLILFNQAVYDYKQELNSLKGFNQHLGRNIEELGKIYAVLCGALDKTSETVGLSAVAFNSCSEELKSLVDEIRTENNRLEGLSGLINLLSQKLDESALDRKLFLKAVDEIPDRLLNYNEAAVARVEKRRCKEQ